MHERDVDLRGIHGHFLCQVFGVDLGLGGMIIVIVMAVITAVGAAGVPGGSIPLLVGILAMMGVPPEGIAIVLEWTGSST